ncbi:hypothetical protein QBC47DRAFT_411210 [Echria macrotheca]|uniref:Uncharacterized protein n=1 Tax=Echria macrotheca TaxID=438768 RepID=A0AAJ0FEU7_9PEZI|nr:hypothetical protein QBC47DRAFT_411210 [Echria macrotheca]
MKPISDSQKEAEAKVRAWGFPTVFTWTDRPNAYYPPHSHAGVTTHLILAGELTIAYPSSSSQKDGDDNKTEIEKVTYGVGDRIDVPAGRVHEVWMGREGCTYVIGE